MLPVQVRIVSSASCSLSEASALLQRFLSASDASFAREYVANVAQALQDSISTRSGTHLHFPTPSESPSRKKLVDVKQTILVAGNSAASSPHNKRKKNTNNLIPSGLGDEKQSLSSAENVGQDADASMEVMPEAEHAFGRHKKKRRHSAVENGLETGLPLTSDSSFMHHDKKRRKKETETDDIGTEDYGLADQKHHDRKRSKKKQETETEKVATDYPALHNQKFLGKKKRKKDKQGKDTEDMETLLVPENGGSPVSLPRAKRKVEVSNVDANNAPMSAKVEELAGSLKRKQKEGKAFHSATPVKPLEFENLASEERKKTKKKRRKKGIGEFVRQTPID